MRNEILSVIFQLHYHFVYNLYSWGRKLINKSYKSLLEVFP